MDRILDGENTNNRGSGRVSKTSTPASLLNESNIAAIERELDDLESPPLSEDEAPPPPPPPIRATRLDDEQEQLLIQWVRRRTEYTTYLTAPQVTTSANQILNRDGGNYTISKAWVDRFIKGLPDDLKPSKKRPSRASCIDPSHHDSLELWFDRLKPLVARVSPANIYTVDDTTFRIGLGTKARKYVTTHPLRPIYDPWRWYTEWITTYECIAADGWAIDPLMVFQKYLLEGYLSIDGIPGGCTLTTTPKGLPTEKDGFDWIVRFHDRTKDRAPDNQPRLLLFPCEPQYLSFSFLQFFEQHNIIPYCFPQDIGHLMHPFDGKHFRGYKQYWKDEYCRGIGPDDADEEKLDFMEKFFPNREKALKPELIKKAFADKGIFPWDSSQIN